MHMPLKTKLHPLAITGPTASGKTVAALWLAQHLSIEIISVDSALVYRRMNVGTAKPNKAELAAVPHHLIDIREPFESYNAADFLKDATRLVDEIAQRGHWPVFVGGTMLYLQCLIHGIDHMPEIDMAVRAAINERAAQLGWPTLHRELQTLDPVTAARLPPLDAQRIGRALEVVISTGQTLSSLQKGRGQGLPGVLSESRLISLEPQNRSLLHQRIAARLTTMMEHGFLAEAVSLVQDPLFSAQHPAMRAVGYRQAFEVLHQWQQEGRRVDPNNAKDQQDFVTRWHEPAAAATRQLAKRQLTWLRAMKQRQVITMEALDAAQQVGYLALALSQSPT
jgi:tRNA dimethylallyltransferase